MPTSPIQVTKIIKTSPKFTSYQFSYETIGGRMTGLLNVPSEITDPNPKVIILIRGYVPLEIYQPGVGTKAAGETLANSGYITLAPDFLGYGESDAELSDVLEARFIKPVQVINLIQNIELAGIAIPKRADQLTSSVITKSNKLGIWAHSNGGQIAVTALEGLGKPLPTTLWAPVTAPFPYSILFFSDEDDDEGKAARASVAIFEKNYDAFDFSLTKHLTLLSGPLQLHQGTSDEAVPMVWSREFRDKIKAENKRRLDLNKAELSATISATPTMTSTTSPVSPNLKQPVSLTYFEYAGADHNMKPGWDQAMARDLEFFAKNIP